MVPLDFLLSCFDQKVIKWKLLYPKWWNVSGSMKFSCFFHQNFLTVQGQKLLNYPIVCFLGELRTPLIALEIYWSFAWITTRKTWKIYIKNYCLYTDPSQIISIHYALAHTCFRTLSLASLPSLLLFSKQNSRMRTISQREIWL